MNNKIIEALNFRYAVKKFDPNKKISKEDLDVLVESIRLAPSSINLQPWKIILVKSIELRKKISAASTNQNQFENASDIIIISCKTKLDKDDIETHINTLAETRNKDPKTLEGFKQNITSDLIDGPKSKNVVSWMQRQCYIPLGFILHTAALLKIDACPMEGFNIEEFDKILGLDKKNYSSLVCVALGYRSSEDNYQFEKKVRYPKEKNFIEL